MRNHCENSRLHRLFGAALAVVTAASLLPCAGSSVHAATDIMSSVPQSTEAANVSRAVPASAAGSTQSAPANSQNAAAGSVQLGAIVRNETFTNNALMQGFTGNADPDTWSSLYLTKIENTYWDFTSGEQHDSRNLTLELIINTYRNLEQFLDNGYRFEYQELKDYAADYLSRRGYADEFYNTLTAALNNPYIDGRPAAAVTATTYNGRDYSPVFDAQYYYDNNPDLQQTIGNNPPELLRHFVEIGISQGRRGNAAFDVTAYKAKVDADVMNEKKLSSAYAAKPLGAPEPLGIYSYSLANYYGKFLGHYQIAEEVAGNDDAGKSADVDAAAAAAALTRESASGNSPAATGAPLVGGTIHEESLSSVYTGLPTTEALANQRPIAVMMPTDAACQPNYGISRADVLYEMMEEGGISRQMAIINDWKGMERIGNLRSCRLYYTYAAKEWDPILIHFGGVAYMKGTIDKDDIQNLSGTYEYGVGGRAPGASRMYRTKDRKAPHNAYISSTGISKAMKQLGYPEALRADYYNHYHFHFADGINDLSQYGAGAQKAVEIDLSPVFEYTKSRLTYNAADGLYYKYILDQKQVDGMNGRQLTFSNVIVQNVTWRQLDRKGYLGMDMLGTKMDGWFFTRGKAIHINWWKTIDHEPTRYYDDAGNEITLNRGKTYIAIAQAGKTVAFR